jgi:hypothetical protein
MDNPWKELGDASPFVLPSDKPKIDDFNRRYANNARRMLRLDIRPEPFIGNFEAPIVLLFLNPGYTAADQQLHVHPEGQALWRVNVLQESTSYPFYMLDPRVAWAPGAYWWRRTLNKLIALADLETVARSVLCVEFFPYHSIGDPGFPGVVPSQHFGFKLVEKAIDRGATILITRSSRAWRDHVPRLNGYHNAYDTRNPQQAIIGPGNYPDAFPIVSHLLHAQ